MNTVYFKGLACHIRGNMPKAGTQAPSFSLVGKQLEDVKSTDFIGKRMVLNIFPSLDTDVCAMSVRKFNNEASQLINTVVISISMDLPFAASRFCETEGIKHVITASAFRSQSFAEKYGIQLIDGPLAGLLSRSIIVIDEFNRIIYTELVEEITNEPNYNDALRILC